MQLVLKSEIVISPFLKYHMPHHSDRPSLALIIYKCIARMQ